MKPSIGSTSKYGMHCNDYMYTITQKQYILTRKYVMHCNIICTQHSTGHNALLLEWQSCDKKKSSWKVKTKILSKALFGLIFYLSLKEVRSNNIF